MEIEYRTGDLLTSDEAVIAHGCNASGYAFGAGVAGQIRRRFPEAYFAYTRAHQEKPLRLGEVVWASRTEKPFLIGNLITQQNFGHGKQYVSYEAMAECFRTLDAFARLTHSGEIDFADIGAVWEIGLPLIGCGLGGGKWSVISDIIMRHSTSFRPVVYLLDGKIPD